MGAAPGRPSPPAPQYRSQAPPVPGDRRLTTAAAAKLAGVKPSTWRAWQSHGRPRPEPAPPPDGWIELRTPWWWTSTVQSWLDRRPDQNAAKQSVTGSAHPHGGEPVDRLK